MGAVQRFAIHSNSHTIIRSHNLNSRDATSANGGDNANLCHYTVTLNLVIQARIRTIQLRGNSTTGSTGVGGDGFIRVLIPRRTRNNRGVIRTTRYWDRKHSLDGDADAIRPLLTQTTTYQSGGDGSESTHHSGDNATDDDHSGVYTCTRR